MSIAAGTSSIPPEVAACPHCGLRHTITCPRIRKIEYNADGTTKSIEFHGPAPVVVNPQPQVVGPGPSWMNQVVGVATSKAANSF